MYKKQPNKELGDMSVEKLDYQPGMDQFAGSMEGNANAYVERKNKEMRKEASKLRSEKYKGRYQ